MDDLPEDTMERVTHKTQDKGRIKPYNVNLHMVYSLCNYGKTVNKLFVGRYISRDKKKNIDLPREMMNFLITMTFQCKLSIRESKTKSLDRALSRNLLLELKGLVAQQYTIINRKSGPCMIISSRCRKRNKLLELANKNQLLSNFCNKNSKCFLQGGAFPQKPTEESNKNLDFAIDTPPQCLTIQINSTNCAEDDYLLKTNLDE